MVMASTGKPSEETASATCLDCAKIKLSAFITVIPVAQTPTAQTGGTGSGSDSGTGGSTGGTGRHRRRRWRPGLDHAATRAPRSAAARPRTATVVR